MISCLGSLVQFSPAAGRAGAAGRRRCVWGALAVFRPHWVCPAHGCVLSPSTLLRFPDALYGAGPALHAVPVFRSSTKARTRLGLRFVPSPEGTAQAARSLTGAFSPGAARFLPSQPHPQFLPAPVGCVLLVFSCDPPGRCRPSRISGSLWLETGGLFAVW